VHKILTALADPVAIKGRPLEIGASIGLSIYPQDGTTAEALMLYADNAMYRTKLEGRKARAE
jgi:GGDEF domain-containing protein